MPRYLDPKADIVFRKIFGYHPHLLKSFLNAILPLSEDQKIVTLEYLPVEHIPEIPILKRTVADVKCKDNHGRSFVVEMQVEWTDSFKQRLLFESGQAFVKQLQAGEHYCLLQPVYGLGLLAENFHNNNDLLWYHHYQLVNIYNPEHEVIEHLQLIFIELPKCSLAINQKNNMRSFWLRFMQEINEKTIEPPADLMAIPEIREAIHLTEKAAYNLGELEYYDSYWKMISTEKTLLVGRYKEGLKAGLQEGIKEGIKEGQALMMQEMVERLKKAGYSEAEISNLMDRPVSEH